MDITWFLAELTLDQWVRVQMGQQMGMVIWVKGQYTSKVRDGGRGMAYMADPTNSIKILNIYVQDSGRPAFRMALLKPNRNPN